VTRLGRRLATVAILAAVAGPLLAVAAQSGPLEPFGKIFKEPVDTLKGLVQPKSRTAPAPADPEPSADATAETAAPADPEPAPDDTAAAAPAPVDAEDVPLPRLRPGETEAPSAPIAAAVLAIASEADPGPTDLTQHEDAIEAMIAARSLGAVHNAANPDADAEAIAAGEPLGYAAPGDDIAVLPNLRPRVASATATLDEERGSALAGALRPGGSCSKTLSSLGVTAVSVDPIRSGSCGIPAPVEVAALGGGAVKLSMKAVVNCDLASTLAAFMRDVVDPLARQKLGANVTDIRVAAAYHCRTRNGVSGAKLSEHAKGNAIDISAFKVKGEWIEVGGKNGLAQNAFLKDVRKSACGPFTTVLGPGSDAYHSDHFHLDLAERRNRGLYCR
jgi:hypothetical protein